MNLSQSVKLGKKVAEFESEEHESASTIYEAYRSSQAENQKVKEFGQYCEDKLRVQESDLRVTEEALRTVEI